MTSLIRHSAKIVKLANRSASWSVCRHYCKREQLSARCLSTGVKEESQATEDRIVLSDSCVKQLKKLCDNRSSYLRVIVEGGGCSGFQYKFELDSAVKDAEDRVFERDGVGVVVDNESLEFLKGATVDYHEELIRSAFRIISNPQAEQGCSCGASFSLKL